MTAGTLLVNLRYKMETTFKIHAYWCNKQEQDYNDIMQAVDDIGAASLALATQGAQAYSQFIQARDSFKDKFISMTKNYRYIENN
jgi:hypothetical protein